MGIFLTKRSRETRAGSQRKPRGGSIHETSYRGICTVVCSFHLVPEILLFLLEYPLRKSKYLLPSTSHTWTPLPRLKTTGICRGEARCSKTVRKSIRLDSKVASTRGGIKHFCWILYRVTHHKSSILVYRASTNMELLFLSQHNLKNNVMGHPIYFPGCGTWPRTTPPCQWQC